MLLMFFFHSRFNELDLFTIFSCILPITFIFIDRHQFLHGFQMTSIELENLAECTDSLRATSRHLVRHAQIVMQRPPVIETTAQKRFQKTDTIFVFACCDFIASCLDLTRFRDLIQSFPNLLLVLVIVAETYKFTPCNICFGIKAQIQIRISQVIIALCKSRMSFYQQFKPIQGFRLESSNIFFISAVKIHGSAGSCITVHAVQIIVLHT